jgi:hypothetical protein
MKTTKLAKSYRIDDGKHFRLKDFDPADTGGLQSVEQAQERLQKDIARMAELQAKLYAQDSWALLLIFQALDAAGKDGTVKHVMSGVNPEGCQVYSFKVPSATELQHDFLWRTTEHLPERGHIGIFNRSYYEEVLIVRVHPKVLENQESIQAALMEIVNALVRNQIDVPRARLVLRALSIAARHAGKARFDCFQSNMVSEYPAAPPTTGPFVIATVQAGAVATINTPPKEESKGERLSSVLQPSPRNTRRRPPASVKSVPRSHSARRSRSG